MITIFENYNINIRKDIISKEIRSKLIHHSTLDITFLENIRKTIDKKTMIELLNTIENQNFNNILFVAVEKYDLLLVKYLIELGIDINHININGYNALILATDLLNGKTFGDKERSNLFQIVKLLIENNINWNQISNLNKDFMSYLNLGVINYLKLQYKDKYDNYMKHKKSKKFNL